jgi:signal transduction histidine kinase/PAS domain-containing protein
MVSQLATLLHEAAPGVLQSGASRMAFVDSAGLWELRRQMRALVGPRLTDVILQRAGLNSGMALARSLLEQAAINAQQAINLGEAQAEPGAAGTVPNPGQILRDCLAMYQALGSGRFEVETLALAEKSGQSGALRQLRIRAWDTFEVWASRRHEITPDEPVCTYTAGLLIGCAGVIFGQPDLVCIQQECQAQGAVSCCFELHPAHLGGDEAPFVPTETGGKGEKSFAPTAPTAPTYQQAIATQQQAREALELQVAERTAKLLRANDFLQEQIIERRRAETLLKETQQVLTTLMQNLPGMAYRGYNDYQRTMEFVSEGSRDLTGYDSSDLVQHADITYMDLIHPEDRENVWHSIQDAIGRHEQSFAPAELTELGETFSTFRCAYRIITATGEEKWVWEQGRGMRSSANGEILIEGFVTDNTERMRAYQTLEQRFEERALEIGRRRQVAEGLRGILTVLNSNRPLQEILDYIVAQACRLLNTNAAAIYRLQKENRLSIQAYRGLPAEYATIDLIVGRGATGRAVQSRRPVALSDTVAYLAHQGNPVEEPQQRALIKEVLQQFRALLAVPLIIKDEVYGGITVYHPDPREFSAEEIELAVSFADQAALAIENARLREQAERTAVAAERSRLARDLHDAVTQTLFSASLIAEVLPRLWERNPDMGRQRLEELRQLTRGALAEMRTLLLELRPATLTEASLADLLRQLTEAITGRARVPVMLTVEGERDLPPEVKVALYRITQETLNNVAKHAGASRAAVILRYQPDRVMLHIGDDGRGFKLADTPPDSLGLSIMRERAEAIGADLRIESEPGEGTQVFVTWQDAGEVERL